METVLIAAIVAFSSMTAPLLLAMLTNKQRREEKREDYARQERVAAKVEDVARIQAQTTQDTQEKLDVIHTLVNGGLSETKEEIKRLTELLETRAKADLAELARLRARIEGLRNGEHTEGEP